MVTVKLMFTSYFILLVIYTYNFFFMLIPFINLSLPCYKKFYKYIYLT